MSSTGRSSVQGKVVVLLMTLVLSAGWLHAAIETAGNRLTGTAVVTGASVTAADNKYTYMVANPSTWYSAFKINKGRGRVRASFDHGSLSYVSAAYDYNFLLKIQYQDTTLAAATTIYRTVRAAYDPAAAAAYQDAGVYEVNNVKVVWIKVTIDSIYNNLTAAYVSSVPANMFVEASTEVERYYPVDYTTAPSTSTLFYAPPATTGAGNDSNEVRIEWNYIAGAEEYDLEWTYVNDYDVNGGTLATSAINYDFTHNSTRITTSQQHYNIPVLFDRGWLLFRIRAVGRAYYSTTGEWKRVYGKWTSDASGGSANTVNNLTSTHRYQLTTGHESKKNWQYVGTFAEEGKKKEVISYYDGSLRNRQTVTKTSTDKTVLVGETFYDFQGRAAVTALPAPVPGTDEELKFYNGFNRVDTSGTAKTYSRYDFDKDQSTCSSSALPMSTNSGASRYYSPANTEITFQQAWLPDAEKFPFAQVEYMPDNTGRVRRQSGVGPEHQLGGGHETQYFYGQPFQEELDRIFGSEAGYKKHYNKTVTIDANGQASVTYLDQEGRTVATALAGNPPSNLQPLKDASGNVLYTSSVTTINVDLLGKDTIGAPDTDQDDNILSSDGKTLSVNSQLTVVNSQTYGFTYSMTGYSYHDECMPDDTCYQCVYDLTIEVRDQCGNAVSGTPVTQTVGGVHRACASGAASFTLSPSPLNLSLSPGVYTVSKKLSVNQSALDSYTANYITQSTCVRTEQSFIDSAMNHIDTSGCHLACTTCADAEYISPCEAAYQGLLDDVSPGGQYAEYLVAGSPAPSQYPLSVLNDGGNQLPMLNADWRHPIINETSSHYYEADGTTISRVQLVQTSNTTYSPPVTGSATVTIVNGVPTVEPQYLASVNDFIANWKPSWAKSLVDYHPEYRYYAWCVGNTTGRGSGADTLSSDEYDSLLIATTTVAAAHAKKLLNPLGNAYLSPSQSNCKDPYFRAAGLGSAQYSNASPFDACDFSKNYQGSNTSIWKMAKIMSNCGTIYGTSTDIDNCLKQALNVTSLPSNDTAYIVTDADWMNFRSLYLSIKQHFQSVAQNDTARYWDSYNGCIGNQQYNPMAAGMYGVPFYNSPFNDTYDTLRRQPCGYTYPLYANKVKRFADENDLYPGMAAAWTGPPSLSALQSQTNYNNYLLYGQCPNAVAFQGLLNAINAAGHLKATNDSLYKYTAFTSDLYHAMVPSGSFAYVLWSGSGSGTTLSVSIGNATCSGISLTFPSGGYSWSGLGSSFDIVSFSQLVATATYSFTVVATVYDHSLGSNVNVLLTGSSGCVPVNCSFSTSTCEPTGEALELFNLVNMITAKGTLYTTSSPGDTITTWNTGNYFNNTQLRNRFNSSNQFWLKTSSTTFKIWDGTNVYPSMEIIFTTALPTSITAFSNPTILSGDTLQMTAYNGSYTTVKCILRWHHTSGITNYDGNIAVGTCGAATPMACSGDEYQRRDDLQALFALLGAESLLKSPTSSGTPLDTCTAFTSLLEAPLGFSNYNWIGTVSGNTLNGTIKNTTTSTVAGTATLTFTSTPSGGNTWSSVRRITGLWADESNLFNGVAYGFSGNAWFADGTSRTFTGTSCYAIRNCSVCMANAGNVYENFDNASSSAGTTLTYTSSCPSTGGYTITSSARTLCSDTTLTGYDHTQPGSGKYFFTKYSSNGPQTIWSRSTTVSAYTAYTFSAWYMDVSTNSETHVTPELWVGSTMLTSVTVTDNAGVWKKLQGTWNGQSSSGSVTLYVKTSGAGSVNTRLGIDDIGFYTNGCDPVVQLTPSPTYPYCDSCRQHQVYIAQLNAHTLYAQYIDSVKAAFQANYITQCMGHAVEAFNVSFSEREYHYTLYYYDQSGNLTRTVPPDGVNIINLATYGQAIKTDRHNRTVNPSASKTFFTAHTMATTYTYNSLNQLVMQVTPDGDTTRFWYDLLGRIVASQNAKQKAYAAQRYSYTVYDAQGRIAEVGELAPSSDLKTMSYATRRATLNAWNYPDNWDGAAGPSNPRYQVTKTYYDAVQFASASARMPSGAQQNLRKRVASAAIYPVYYGNANKYTSASHYSYDIHGNVKELVQEDSTLRVFDDVANARYQSYKKFSYYYDLVSGKVNELWYQDAQADAFYYRYEYDADNRVTAAYTSNDYRTWDRDAKYAYYQHGPLARTEIGQDKVQGVDYAYTLHGWIKGVNSVGLQNALDMGRDANNDATGGTTINQYVPADQYSYELTYYDTLTKQDYSSITTNGAFAAQSGSGLASGAPNLWNGNICNMVTAIGYFGTKQVGKAFRYDQLNRITQAVAYTNYNSGTNSWNSSGALNTWKENFTYDQNGNILTLIRHGNSPTAMDSLNYHYTSGKNQLTYVDDGISSGSYGDDIDDQASGNYSYDKIGNLVGDVSEQIDTIKWNVYGKITDVIRTATSTKSDLHFDYDAMGNRICKIAKPRSGSGVYNQDHWTYTYYVRDAQGNTIAVYDRDYDTPTTTYNDMFTLKENHLYGSSRVGVRAVSELQANVRYTYGGVSGGVCSGTSPVKTSTAAATKAFFHEVGRRSYELVNHLGNVLVTVSDARTANHSGTAVTGFNAVVSSATDYYAFGAPMEGRSYSSASYRYGFNGKENDPEAVGTGEGLQDYGMRIYNPGLGRFLSIDPSAKKYPHFSPYQFAGNTPIWASDLDGRESKVETGPKTPFDIIAEQYKASFEKAWQDSHTDPNGKGRVHEYSGVLIKITTINPDGSTTTTYEIHNYDQGTADNSQSWQQAYDNIPANAVVLGNFHTHPYAQKELRSMQRTEHPDFNGNGVPFSGDDFLTYSDQIPDNYFKKDQVLIIVAGTDIFGITITDPTLARQFLTNPGVKRDIDFAGAKNFKTRGNYADIVWAEYVKTQQAYEAEHGAGSSGVILNRAPMGTSQQAPASSSNSSSTGDTPPQQSGEPDTAPPADTAQPPPNNQQPAQNQQPPPNGN